MLLLRQHLPRHPSEPQLQEPGQPDHPVQEDEAAPAEPAVQQQQQQQQRHVDGQGQEEEQRQQRGGGRRHLERGHPQGRVQVLVNGQVIDLIVTLLILIAVSNDLAIYSWRN